MKKKEAIDYWIWVSNLAYQHAKDLPDIEGGDLTDPLRPRSFLEEASQNYKKVIAQMKAELLAAEPSEPMALDDEMILLLDHAYQQVMVLCVGFQKMENPPLPAPGQDPLTWLFDFLMSWVPPLRPLCERSIKLMMTQPELN